MFDVRVHLAGLQGSAVQSPQLVRSLRSFFSSGRILLTFAVPNLSYVAERAVNV